MSSPMVSWISPWQPKESMASKPMAAIGFGLPRSCLNFRRLWWWQSIYWVACHFSSRGFDLNWGKHGFRCWRCQSARGLFRQKLCFSADLIPREVQEKWPDRYWVTSALLMHFTWGIFINQQRQHKCHWVAQAGVARRHHNCNGCGGLQLRLHRRLR